MTNPPHGNNLVIQADKKQILLSATLELVSIVSQLEEASKSNADNMIIVTGINTTIHALRTEIEEYKREIEILRNAAKQKTDPPKKA